MKTCVAIGVVVGLAVSVHAQTRLEYQVSHALQENWQSSIAALPGDSIDIRVRVSYLGTQAPLGLGSIVFQPTISNWISASDFLSPFVNSGGNTTTPAGVVSDVPGQYGRMTPWGRSAIPATQAYRGHLHTVGGTGFLRIALGNFTNWIGEGNNTSGVAGVLCAQLTNLGRTPQDPAFSTQLQDIVVFKFNIVLGMSDVRTLLVDTPEMGFGNLNATTGQRNGHWIGNMNEPVGSIREQAFAVPAAIHVIPGPGVLTALMLGAAITTRRRR